MYVPVHRFLKVSDSTDQSLELTTDSQDLTGVTELTLSPPARTSSVCNGPSNFTEAYRYVIVVLTYLLAALTLSTLRHG